MSFNEQNSREQSSQRSNQQQRNKQQQNKSNKPLDSNNNSQSESYEL